MIDRLGQPGDESMDSKDQESDVKKPEQQISASTDVPLDSVTLNRLFDEVRNGTSFVVGAYNRVHNRHNRS
jgi:hypothetical protein